MTFISLIKPYKKKIFGILFCVFCLNLLSLVLPWAVKILIDEVFANKDFSRLNFLMGGLLCVLMIRSLFGFAKRFLSGTLGEQVVCDLQQKIYWHIERLSLTQINKVSPAQIMARMTGDVDSARRFLFCGVIDSVYALVSFVLIVGVLSFLNLRMTVVALIFLPLFFLMYVRLLPELHQRHALLREAWAHLTSRVSESLHGIRMIRAFVGEEYEKDRFRKNQEKILSLSVKTHALDAWLWIGIEFFSSLGMIGMLWVGGRDVMAGQITPGAVVAFYSYLGMLFSPIIQLVVLQGAYQEAKASLEHINQIFQFNDEVVISSPSVSLSRIKGKVEFDRVSFGYSKNKKVLDQVSFSIDPGEMIGVVGTSGVGKTTLMSLLLRFFDPQQGRIFIDGHELKTIDLKVYRQQVAVVLQDDFLFNGTIQENIRYGSFRSSQADVIRAAQAADLHEFVSQLPDGYEAQIGERGMNFSSGQRQRVAIARALLKDPAILILDEATSALDALTENRIQNAIKRQLSERTIFVVAHRFSTIMDVDQVMVLDQGHIVEMGTHDYLLQRKGFYSNLYLEQFKEGV